MPVEKALGVRTWESASWYENQAQSGSFGEARSMMIVLSCV